mgnify:CR=1 FL=1
MKKGQIEIIGLTVIVIILAVALLIALSFILRPDTGTIEETREGVRINSLMNDIFNTNINFDINDERKIKDKIRECILNSNPCSANDPDLGNKNVKTVLMDILNGIFNNQDYYLTIEDELNSFTVPNINGCTGPNRLVYSGLVTHGSTSASASKITYKLELCRLEF